MVEAINFNLIKLNEARKRWPSDFLATTVGADINYLA